MGSYFQLRMRALSVPAGPGFVGFWTFRCPRGRSTDRPSIGTKPNDVLAELFTLLDAVMAGSAEALKVIGIKEQRFVAPMWPDVVTYRGRRDILLLQAVDAQWMRGQLPLT